MKGPIDKRCTFELKRQIDYPQSLYWLLGTKCDEIKARYVDDMRTKIEKISKREYSFDYTIPNTFELLYSISFELPVKFFKLWIQDSKNPSDSTLSQIIVDNPSELKSISFDPPLPIGREFTIHISYTYELGVDLEYFPADETYFHSDGMMNPLLTVGFLQKEFGENFFKTYQWKDLRSKIHVVDNTNTSKELKPFKLQIWQNS